MKIEISSKHFLNRSYGNNSQYSKIYQDRLSQFRPILRDNLKSKFGNCQYEFVEQIPDLSSEKNKVQMLIGIIFKKMHKRPNVFQEIYADNDEIVDDLYKSEAKKEKIERSQDLPVFGEKENKTTTNFYECYISQEDTVYLEDEIQRIKIKFKNNEQNFLTTGCCVGICGRNVGGTLEIDNYIFPIRNQIERRLFQTKDKILFLSTLADVTFDKNELDIDEMKTNLNETILNSFHLLIDDIKYQKILFNDIKSLILIGNILPSFSHDVYKKHRLVNCSVGNRLENLPNNQLKIERLDKILFKLLENLSIYIVPGANDPTTYILPQQPISKIFFPRCKDHHNFHSITSPSILNLIEENDEGKLKLLISNGRVINDCMKQTTFPKPIDAMEYLLKTSHLCPMAPDSIPMVPFEKDPFQLRDIPDIFICGNQPIYEHKSFQNSSYRSELISIPSFINKFQSIILDLKSMTSQKFSGTIVCRCIVPKEENYKFIILLTFPSLLITGNMQQPSRFDMVRLGKQSKQNDKTTKKVHEEPAPKTHKVTKTEINLPNELEAIEWIPFQTFIGKKESVNLVGNVDYVDLYSQNQSLLTESPLMSVIVQCIHNLWNKRAVDIPKMLHHDLLANSERMNAKDNVSVSPKKKLRRSLYDIELSEAWTPWAYVKDYDKTVRLAHSKFAVVLYFMGAWRKFEVDDSVPIDKNLKPLLPVSSNNLWPILLCKAILMVLSSTSTFYQTTTDSLYLISKMILNLLTGTQIEMMPLNIYRTDDELWKLLLQSAELFISFQDSLSIIPQCVIDNDNVSVPIFVFGKNFSTNNLMLQIRDVNLTKLPKIDLPRWKYFRTTCADHEKEEYNNPLSRFVDILPPDNSWYFKSPSALSRKNSKSSIQGIMPTEYNSFSLKEFRESFDYLMMSNISEAFKYTYVNESSNLTDLPTGSPENPFMRSTNNIRSTIPHVYTDRTPIYSHHFKNAYDKIKVQETFISIVNETKDNNLLLITINTLPKLPTTKKTVIDEGQNIVGEAKLQKSAEKMHKEKRRGTIFPSKSRSKNSAYEINSFAILRLSPLFNHHEHYPFIIQYTSEKIFERKLETTYHEAKVLSIPVGVNYLRLRVESATDFVFSLSSNIPLNFLTLNMAIPKICEKTFVVNRIGNKLLKLTLNILDCYSLGNDSIGDAEHRLLNYISKHSSQKLYVKDRILLKFYLCLSKLFVEVVENGLAGKKGDGVNTNYSEVSDSPSFQEHVKYSLNSIFFSFRLYNPIIQKPYYETVNNCVGKLDKLFPNQMDYIRKPYLFTVLDSGHSDSDIASNDDASIYEDKKRIVKFDMLGNPLELKVENLKDYRMKSTPENQIAHTIFEKLTLEIHKNFDYYADQLFQYFVDELTLGDLRRQTAGLPAFEKYLKYFFVEPSKLFPSLTINAQKLHSFKLQGKTNLNVTVRTKVPDLFGTAIQLKLPGEDTTRLLSHSILYQTIFHSAFTKEEFSRLSEYFNGNIPHFYYYNLIVQCEFMSGSGDSTLSHVDSKIAKEKFNTIKGFLTIINNDNGLTLPNFGMINCPYFYPPNKFGYTFTICAYINPTVLSYCEDKGITSIMGNWSLTIISGTAIPLIIQNHWTSIREQEASIFTEFRASKDTTSRPPLPTNPEPILTSSMKLPKEKEVINNDTTDKKSKDKEPHPTKSKKKQRFRKDKKIVLENDDKESSSKRGGRTIPKRVESRAFIEEVFEDNRELVPFNYHTSIYNLTNILRNGKYVQEYARNPQYSIIEIPDIIFPDKPDTSVKKYLTILHDITISVHISLLDPTAVFELTILDNNKILRKQTGKGTMFMPGVFLCGNNNNRKANSFERSYDDSDELPSFYLTKATHKKPSQSSYGRRYTIKMRFLKPIKLTKEQTETLTKITNLKFNSVKASELFKPTLGPSPSEVPEGRFDKGRQSKRNALLEIDFSLWYIRLIVNKTENKYLYVTRSADTIRKIFQFKFEVENMEPGRLKRAQEYRSKFNIETIKKIDKKKFYRPIRYLTAHLSDQIKSDAQYRRLKANKLKHYRYMKNEDFHMNFICRAISRTPSSIGETKIKNLVFETSSTD